MITNISANGSNDINILLVSLLPAPAAWAKAGVISIRTILVKRGNNSATRRRQADPGKFARTIAAAVPIATPRKRSFCPSFEVLAATPKARYGCGIRNPGNVEKAPKTSASWCLQDGDAETFRRHNKGPCSRPRTQRGRADRACARSDRGSPVGGLCDIRDSGPVR